MNYFQLFALPVQFHVDKDVLKKKYLALSRKFHPDYFANSDLDEQQEALETSAQINKGFKTFSQVDETIKYVLELKGLLVPDEKYALAPDFLMEMMELNEELAELPESIGEDRNNLVQRIDKIENELYEQVKNVIENYKENDLTEKELLQVKDYYFKKKYLQRLHAQLGQKL